MKMHSTPEIKIGNESFSLYGFALKIRFQINLPQLRERRLELNIWNKVENRIWIFKEFPWRKSGIFSFTYQEILLGYYLSAIFSNSWILLQTKIFSDSNTTRIAVVWVLNNFYGKGIS